MPITKIMKGLPSDILAAEGLMYHDLCLTPCQRECIIRLSQTVQIEQEAYMSKHPEITAILELFISRMAQTAKRKDVLKEAAQFFTKPIEELEKDVRARLGVPEEGPYTKGDKPIFDFEDADLQNDLKNIIMRNYPPEPWNVLTPSVSTPNTPSSSFMSIMTSESTVPTPEPIRTPSPTMSETFFIVISNAVDKAIFLHFDDRALRYDTAYVELVKCVERAMEIPVIEIKEDIAVLFYNAYKMFELNIMEKERLAAELAWEKRMRKKLKRTLRRMNNFKGYVTPPTPKSEISSHESYKMPPAKPCICHPQFYYNRYPKDRFGIYLPTGTHYLGQNVTATPAMSVESVVIEEPAEDKGEAKSVAGRKSVVSGKVKV